MKKIILVLTLVITLGSGWAQRHNQIPFSFNLNEKSVSPAANFQEMKKNLKAQKSSSATQVEKHFILQFYKLPSLNDQKKLKEQGVSLLNYVQGNAYFVSVTPKFYGISKSESKNIRALVEIRPEYKIANDIATGQIPEYAKASDSRIKIIINYFDNSPESFVKSQIAGLKLENIKIRSVFHQIYAETDSATINKLSSLDWVQNIALSAPPAELENNHGLTLHRSNVLNGPIPGLGYGLTGKGVKMGLWDNDVFQHRDFNGRVINREYEAHGSDHGTHTCGTIGSAGIIDPLAKGMAPEITVYAWNFNIQSNGLDVPSERLISLDEDGIEITSNSWGYTVSSCPNVMPYNTEDHNDDLITNWYPYFLYVTSAGNTQSKCPDGFSTSSKNIKNALVVGAVDQSDRMSSFSSFGPAKDGRLLPNICGDGVNVYSTFFDNGYGIYSGTSMATPGVAGTMALIYQRYKETHGGKKPDAAFLRALACNTATDQGNPGPDYKFGYGEINGVKAVEAMEKNYYYSDSVGQNDYKTRAITVPEGAVALKVMLAWNDPAGTVGSSRALVNDLDLNVSHEGDTTLPWVLNPLNPADEAKRDYDGLNNMEQVTIADPQPGTYNVNVMGFEIPSGVQNFSVAYDVVMPSLKLTYPLGGESFTPGEVEIVRWDAEGYNDTFTLEYSVDGGITYSMLAGDIPSTKRYYSFEVPHTITKDAKFRISNGSTLYENKSTFNIMHSPSNVSIEQAQCNGDGPFLMTWDAVPNSKYEVLRVKGQEYEHLAYTSTNSFSLSGIAPNNDNWYCVKAIDLATGAISQRSLAATLNPAISIPALPFSENFESQAAPNFYFTSQKGLGSVRYANTSQMYGIRLEGSSGETTDWVDAIGAECFTSNPGYIVKASICNVDATSYAGKVFRLKFDYRQKYRDAEGTSYFRVKVNGNILPNSEGTTVYGATMQESYKSVYYDLTAFAGLASVNIEFEAVCKTDYTTYITGTGGYDYSDDSYDMGDFVNIDNIELNSPPVDLVLTSLITGSGYTNAETFTINVKNVSGITVSNIPVSFQINEDAVVTEIIAGPIAPLADVSYSFAKKADLSINGAYDILAYLQYPDDKLNNNDTLKSRKVNNGNDILFGKTSTISTCSAVIVDPSGRYSDYQSSVNSSQIIKPGSAGKNVKITFTEFATEADYDFLYIYDGTVASAANLAGTYSGDALPPSYTSKADGGELLLKFVTDSNTEESGFTFTTECVDKAPVNASLTAITAPMASGLKTAAETVTVTLKNVGTLPITSAVLHYQINSLLPVSETSSTAMAVGKSLSYSFATKADLSIPGTYTLKAWVEVAGDPIKYNDTITASIISIVPIKDAEIAAINSEILPARTALTTIGATIRNNGTLPLTNVPVAYTINGGPEINQTLVGILDINTSTTFTFTTKTDMTTPGATYDIKVYTKLAGDVESKNDTMTAKVITPVNAVTNVVGSFSDLGEVAVAPAIPAINLVHNYTLECWVNPETPSTFGRLFDKTYISLYYQTEVYSTLYPENSYMLSVTTPTGSFVCYYPGALKPNQWQHVALTVSSTNVYTLYVDGVEQPPTFYTGSFGETRSNTAMPLYIGNNGTFTRGVKGKMDEVRIWNSCLDQATIANNLVTDYPPNTSGMAAYYKFREDGGKYLYDYSVNDNTAILRGVSETGQGKAGNFWSTPGLMLSDYKIPGQAFPTTFEESTNTLSVIMESADLGNLTASFNPAQKSIIKVDGLEQISGVTSNNFATGPVTYTAEGVGFNTGIQQQYSVVVTNNKSSLCDLIGIEFNTTDNLSLDGSIVMDGKGSTFYKKVSPSMDITSLKATFTLSPGARLYINGIEQSSPQQTGFDYSNPVMIKVVSENGLTFKNYNVTLDGRSSDALLSGFGINDFQLGTAKIDQQTHTINVWVDKSADLSMLTAHFNISAGAKLYADNFVQLNGLTANNFTSPKVYTLVSEDESSISYWLVSVAKDNVKPVLVLNGTSPMNVPYGSAFVDPGVSAVDNADGDINASVITAGNVNTNKTGTYVLTYNVQDVSGNSADEITRTVNVVKATATVYISDLSVYYNGNPQPVTVVTEPAGLATKITYNGSETVPVNIGTYQVVAEINDENYEGSATSTLEIMLNTGLSLLDLRTVHIYASGTEVFVNIPVVKMPAHLTVYDISGIPVYESTQLAKGLNQFNLNIKPGVYVVKLLMDTDIVTQKVILFR